MFACECAEGHTNEQGMALSVASPVRRFGIDRFNLPFSVGGDFLIGYNARNTMTLR